MTGGHEMAGDHESLAGNGLGPGAAKGTAAVKTGE